MQSILNVADNSGAKSVMCIKVLGGSKRFIAHTGDIICVSVKEMLSSKLNKNPKVSKGKIYKGVIVRCRSKISRKDGTFLNFNENAVVLINEQKEPIGTRINGPVPRELRNANFTKIISLAPEVI